MNKSILNFSQFVNEMFNEEVQPVPQEPVVAPTPAAPTPAATQPAPAQPTQPTTTVTPLPADYIRSESIEDAVEGNTKVGELISKFGFKPDGNPITINTDDVVKFYKGNPGQFAQIKQELQTSIQADIQAYELVNPKQAIYYRVTSGTDVNDPNSTVELVGVLAGQTKIQASTTTEQPEQVVQPEQVEQPAVEQPPVQERSYQLYEAKRYLRN